MSLLYTLLNLVFIYLFSLFIFNLGFKTLQPLRFKYFNGLEEAVMAMGLGLGLLAYITLLLGLLGILLSIVFFILLLVVNYFFRNSITELYKKYPESQAKGDFSFHIFGTSITLCFIITLVLTLLGALAPAIGNDSLCYHLGVPKIFLERGKILYLPFTETSLFPYLMQMLYLLGIVIHDATLAKCFHFMTGVLCVMAVFSLAKQYLDYDQAVLAGAIFLLTPGIYNQMTTAYIDIGLTLMCFLTYYAAFKWTETKKAQWMIFVGIFGGLSFSIKYHAFFPCFVILLLFISECIRSPEARKVALKHFLILIGIGLLFSFVWYLRSYLHTGTPVYPYLSSNYGGESYDLDLERNGYGKNLWTYLMIFWNFTMHPADFGGGGNQYGIIYLVFLPFIPLAWKNKKLRVVTIAAFLHVTIWFFFRHNIRYLFPVVPLLAILAAGIFQELRNKGKFVELITSCAMIFILILNTGMAFYYNRNFIKVSVGLESKENYLRQWERSFVLAEEIHKHTPESAKILNAEEIRGFYIKRETVREKIYRRQTRYHQKAANSDQVIASVRQDGFDHILITEEEAAPHDVTKQSPLEIKTLVRNPAFVVKHLTLLKKGEIQTRKDGKSHFQLFAIKS